MPKRNPDLETLTRQYEIHNRSEGKSPRTVQWYNDVLGLFLEWLRAEELPTDLAHLTEDEARAFTMSLYERPGLWGKQSSNTVNNRVRALRAFFAWLHRRGYTTDNRLKDFRPPKTTRKVIETLNSEEVARIFSAINPDSALGARNTAIYSLMLDTGLRLSETVNLVDKDVHFEDRYVKVLGKGNKERMVAFGTACQRSLLHYAQVHRSEPAHPGIDTFFLTIDGYPMTPDSLRSLTERLSRAANVPRLHPHLLRHTYATQFLINGGDVFLLKQNLGHTTLAMVELYVHMASQLVAVKSQGFSPLDRFEPPNARRFRHPFNRRAPQGQIYPNSGGGTHRRKPGPKRAK